MITNITLETVDKVWDSVETILRIVNRNDQIKPIEDTIIKMKEDNIWKDMNWGMMGVGIGSILIWISIFKF